ncbi:MAG: DUF58 domain-containing protein [Dehalococcoidia bacterium]
MVSPSNHDAALHEILRKVRRIEIRSRRLVTDLFLGEYHSVFRGKGIEFAEVREYQAGDDIRIIDWNVTARMGSPYVKKFVEERESTVYLVVDVSGSFAFGTTHQTKREVATEVCALLALSAVENNDRVGLVAFSDRVEKFVPPKKGTQHVLRLVRELLWLHPQGRGTDIGGALSFLNSVARRRSIVFLLSDFLAQDYEAVLRVAARRHDLIGLTVIDPRETELPPVGLLEVEDVETGQRLVVDTLDPQLRRLYAQAARRQQEARRRCLGSAGADQVEVSTHESYVRPLLAFFRARARRR